MPTKNCELGPGKICLIGPSGEIQLETPVIPELSITGFEENDKEPPSIPIIRGDCEAELVCTTKINRKVFLRVILGRSNNWLKMHGYPMTRGRYTK